MVRLRDEMIVPATDGHQRPMRLIEIGALVSARSLP
jgi:hypothetical protein